MHSKLDTEGKLFIACSECERGGNGTNTDKCSSGWRVKKWNGCGCFLGILMSKYTKELEAAEKLLQIKQRKESTCQESN